jgi:hypothetical protein
LLIQLVNGSVVSSSHISYTAILLGDTDFIAKESSLASYRGDSKITVAKVRAQS